ncbi:UNVERIFIED_CONTAM: hypothetical protein HDU68_008408 [Siphonaria sp. JEL0065]|nr:hypothetical protein HDU68_008408 [Siphonaria sp. JEL0065]
MADNASESSRTRLINSQEPVYVDQVYEHHIYDHAAAANQFPVQPQGPYQPHYGQQQFYHPQAGYYPVQPVLQQHQPQVVSPVNIGPPLTSALSQENIYTRLDTHASAQEKGLPLLPANVAPEFDVRRQRKPAVEKYLGCCLPKKKKHRVVCGVVTLTIVIVVAVLLGLFIPRYPDIKVYGIDLTNLRSTNTPYLFTFKDPENPNFNELRLRMNLTMSVGTFNPNFYDLNVDHIDLTAQMLANTTVLNNPLMTRSLSGIGGLVQVVGPSPTPTIPNYKPSYSGHIGTSYYGNIIFPSKSWVNYTMIFQLDYTPDPQVGILADPTILEIANACGITSTNGKGRTMKIHYDAASTISSLKAIGFTPDLVGDLSILCPFSPDQFNAVVRKVQGGQDPFKAIQDVFGGGNPEATIAPPPIVIVNPEPAPSSTTTSSIPSPSPLFSSSWDPATTSGQTSDTESQATATLTHITDTASSLVIDVTSTTTITTLSTEVSPTTIVEPPTKTTALTLVIPTTTTLVDAPLDEITTV